MKGILFGIMALLFQFSVAQSETPQVSFQVKKGFSTVKGTFEKVDYTIDLSAATPSAQGKAEIRSISTGNSRRDAHLQTENWFFAEKYPTVDVRSQRITKQSDGLYTGTFEIDIKGTKEVKEITFEVVEEAGKKVLKAEFELSLKTFHIGSGILKSLIGDTVKVKVALPF